MFSTTMRGMSENNAPCASKAQLQKILNEADAVRNPFQGLEGLSTFTFEHADISGSAETKVLVKADVTYRQDLSKRLQKGCMVSCEVMFWYFEFFPFLVRLYSEFVVPTRISRHCFNRT